jgi:tRNA threonylcarbamoyladenosine biosynthesis protein TsaE
LGELLPVAAVVCLSGDLGAGKTTLAQGIARGWGALDPVTSPTFVLINEYRRADGQRLLHVDAFRLAAEVEAEALGLVEMLESGDPVLIEWAEKVDGLVPDERMWVSMSWRDDSRRNLRFEAGGSKYEELLRSFRQAAFGR